MLRIMIHLCALIIILSITALILTQNLIILTKSQYYSISALFYIKGASSDLVLATIGLIVAVFFLLIHLFTKRPKYFFLLRAPDYKVIFNIIKQYSLEDKIKINKNGKDYLLEFIDCSKIEKYNFTAELKKIVKSDKKKYGDVIAFYFFIILGIIITITTISKILNIIEVY